MVIRTGGFWRNLLNTFPICWSATGSHHWRGSLCDKGDVVFSRLRKLRWVAVFNCAVNVEKFRWVERVGSWSWGAARKQNHVQRRIWKIILYSSSDFKKTTLTSLEAGIVFIGEVVLENVPASIHASTLEDRSFNPLDEHWDPCVRVMPFNLQNQNKYCSFSFLSPQLFGPRTNLILTLH